MEQFILRQATDADSCRIWEIIQQAKAQMNRENKQQWDESYPLPANIADDICNGYGYVLCNGDNIVAYGAVIFDSEAAYADLKGKWLSDSGYVVVHRLAVAEEMKRRGIAAIFMQEVEKMSIDRGVLSFKVDTNFDNFYMQKILAKSGFTYCGEITYQNGSRMAYEKLL